MSEIDRDNKKGKETAKQEARVEMLIGQYVIRCLNQRPPDMQPYLDACPTPELRREFRACVAIGQLMIALL